MIFKKNIEELSINYDMNTLFDYLLRDWACSPIVGRSSGTLPTRAQITFFWIFQDLPALCVKW
jgi:hypothetical protein